MRFTAPARPCIHRATAYEKAPNFETFSAAMFSMFQVLCLDGWADLADTVVDAYVDTPPAFPVSLFFIAYISVVVFALMPVMMAAILDNYRMASLLQGQEDGISTLDNHLKFSFDPLLHVLLRCPNRHELHDRLSKLFDIFDTDDSGGVSFEELHCGLKRLSIGNDRRMELTHEEFDYITRGSKFVGEHGALSLQCFQQAMEMQVRLYAERKMTQYMMAIGKEDPGAELMMFCMKSMLSDSHEEVGIHRLRDEAGAHRVTSGIHRLLVEEVTKLGVHKGHDAEGSTPDSTTDRDNHRGDAGAVEQNTVEEGKTEETIQKWDVESSAYSRLHGLLKREQHAIEMLSSDERLTLISHFMSSRESPTANREIIIEHSPPLVIASASLKMNGVLAADGSPNKVNGHAQCGAGKPTRERSDEASISRHLPVVVV